MGQYHVIANLEKRLGYSPRSTGDFLKLTEFGHGGGAMCALVALLDGDWHGERVAIVGDYAESGDLPADAALRAGLDPAHLYAAINDPKWLRETHGISSDWRNVGWLARKVVAGSGLGRFDRHEWTVRDYDGTARTSHGYRWELTPQPDSRQRVVVNLDRAEKLDPAAFGDDRSPGAFAVANEVGGTLAALAVLLAVSSTGGGRGGGDFRGSSPLVGSWGGHRIGLLDPADTAGYVDISEAVRGALAAAGEGIYRDGPDGKIQRGDPWEDNPWQHLDRTA
ncbi:hypothetical protein AB0331_13895 [Dietzia maris]|uniref:hypothetical protein n=1 Tax=Dietzia maris TaxID=37915 RepID=UPI00344FACF5